MYLWCGGGEATHRPASRVHRFESGPHLHNEINVFTKKI